MILPRPTTFRPVRKKLGKGLRNRIPRKKPESPFKIIDLLDPKLEEWLKALGFRLRR